MPATPTMTQNDLLLKKAKDAAEAAKASSPGAPPSTPGGAAAPMPGTPAASTGPAAKTPASSGHFTNVQQYIAANKGAGQRIGGAIGQTVGQQVGKAEEAIGKGTEGVRAAIDAEKARLAGANMGIFERPTAAAPGTSGLGGGAAAGPVTASQAPATGGPIRTPGASPAPGSQLESLIADPQRLKGLQDMLSGTTQFTQIGQQATGALDKARTELGKAQELAGMTGSEAGRFELLRKSLGRPSYSGGQQSFDQLLVQADPRSGLNQLQKDAQTQAAQASTNLGSTEAQIRSGLTAGSQKAAQIQAEMKSRLGGIGSVDDPSTPNVDESKGTGALGTLQSELEARKAKFITDEQAKEAKVKAALGSTNIEGADPEVLKQLGLAKGANLYDVNLNEILTPSFAPDTVTAQSMANQGDLGWYNALAKLAGTDTSFLKPEQVGTAKGFEIDPAQIAKLKTELAGGATRVSDLRNQLMKEKAAKDIIEYTPGAPNAGYGGGGTGPRITSRSGVNQAKVDDLQKQIDALLKRTVGKSSKQETPTTIVPGKAPVTAIPAKKR